ncbi:MAG: hypothetical protein HXY35_00685 [Chloroflexi bacterium]|nr:hypothetical protein [Chloroflexota bacterium]
MPTGLKKYYFFTLMYLIISLSIEAAMITFGKLEIPKDNARIAPVLLTIPPVLAALIANYRKYKEFFIVVFLVIVFTLVITLIFTTLTGISTGLAEPIINRTLAGFLAAWLTNRLTDLE